MELKKDLHLDWELEVPVASERERCKSTKIMIRGQLILRKDNLHQGTRHLDARHCSIYHPLNQADTRGCYTRGRKGIQDRRIFPGRPAVRQNVSVRSLNKNNENLLSILTTESPES